MGVKANGLRRQKIYMETKLNLKLVDQTSFALAALALIAIIPVGMFGTTKGSQNGFHPFLFGSMISFFGIWFLLEIIAQNFFHQPNKDFKSKFMKIKTCIHVSNAGLSATILLIGLLKN